MKLEIELNEQEVDVLEEVRAILLCRGLVIGPTEELVEKLVEIGEAKREAEKEAKREAKKEEVEK